MDPTLDPLGSIPRWAIFKSRRVRIIGYEKERAGGREFEILDRGDEKRLAARSELTFVKA